MIKVKILKKAKERKGTIIGSGISAPGATVTPGVISEAIHAATADLATEATHAQKADRANYAKEAEEAAHATSAQTLDPDSPVRDEFLSKVKPDTAAELIDFAKGLHVGDFEAGASGGCFHMDADDHSYAELDKLYVRVKAFFEELTIIKKGVLAGDQYITPGGGIKCVRVEETATAYRCYFLSGQDGELTDCAFAVGDQAIARLFNARTGTSNKVSNHSYWRLVSEVVNDAAADDAGNHYGYIALSKTDCDTGSDAPQPGDEICQFGNRNATDRQSALLFSTTAADAPCVKLYSGINSYSLEGKAVVSFGRDPQTGKIFFRLGASGATQYLEYKQDSGLTVAGKISSQSTVVAPDGSEKTFADAIEAGKAPNLMSRYSADASAWHTNYQSGDVWMQTSNDGGQTWGAAVRIQGASYADNLILKSDAPINTSSYLVCVYDISEDLEQVPYTCTIWGELGEGKECFSLMINGGANNLVPNIVKVADGVYRATGTFWVAPTSQYRRKVYLYHMPSSTTSISRVNRIKLEKGTNSNTVWTPAASEMVGKDGSYPVFNWAKGTSTTAPTSGWQSTPPTDVKAGEYVWMCQGTITPPSTTPVWSTAVRLTGDTGASGSDVYMLDLSNEVAAVACNAAGTPTSALPSSTITVYKGGSVDSGWSFSKADSGCISAINGTTLNITAISSDNATVTVTATKSGTPTLTTTMSVYKVRPGQNGSSYKTLTSPANNTAFYPYSATLAQWKDWASRESSGWLCGNFSEIQDGDTVCVRGTISDVNNTPCQFIGVVSRKDSTKSAVCIGAGGQLIYGQPGSDGTNYTPNLLLDKYAQSASNTTVIDHGIEIAANSNQDTYFRVYTDGNLEVSAGDVFTLSFDVAGLTAENNGKWSFYILGSKDTGLITLKNGRCYGIVTATKTETINNILLDDQTRNVNSAGIRITNVKLERGVNQNPVWTPAASEMVGEAAVVYQLELSANNISRDALGNLSASSITVQKYKTTGASARTLTTEKTVRYQRIGLDSSTTALSAATSSHTIELPTEEPDRSKVTAIIVELLDGTTVLDRERIPVIEEGSRLGDNLVKDSEYNISDTKYSFVKVVTTEKLVIGDTYTITIWGQLGSGRSWLFYDNYGGVYMGTVAKIGTYDGGEIYSVTFKLPSTMADRARDIFTIYNGPGSGTSTSTIHRVKIEKGINRAPVWTASPYDMDYIKSALKESGSIEGGLVLASLMRLGYTKSNGEYVTMAGMNGIYNGNDKGGGLMLWGGGDMIDPDGTRSGTPATSGIRMDGTAFFCNNIIRFEKNRIMVGDVVQLSSDGLTLIDGSNNALRIGDVNVPELLTAASSSGYLDVTGNSFSSGTVNVYPDGNLFIGANTSINKTQLDSRTLPAGTVVNIAGPISIPKFDGVPLNDFCATIVVDFYLDNTLLQSAHLNLQAGSSGWSTNYSTALRLPRAGKLYGVLHFDYPVPAGATEIAGSPFEGATFIMNTRSWQYTTSNQNTLGKNGFLAAWGQSLLYCGADGVEMRFNNFRLRLDSNGIRKSSNNGSSWSPL
ncbi:MAG: hypothetical protein HDT09_04125 [Bacteroidales bacterium]|nr:hypothetical protein [Bacteroidales bacterium]